jgi:ribosome-binding protein aMBF1 (putative translation factor)
MIKPQDRRHLDFEQWENKMRKDRGLKAEYEKLQPEFAILRARIEKGLSQNELARRIGTKQSVISRLESGRANPSINFLRKLAQALNFRLEINFVGKQ